MSASTVLVVQHEAQCPPGWLGEWLVEAGVRLDVRRPWDGGALPSDLSGHDGLLVLGGEMGAYDDAVCPWLGDTKRLVADAASAGVPTLGVCLGHQLAAVALGGEVAVNPRGRQLGVLDVGWTRAAREDPLFANLAALGDGVPALHWNDDVVTRCPPGAVPLARAGTGELQAGRLASRTWGVQWHPEAGPEIVDAWVQHGRSTPAEREVVARVREQTPALRRTWRVLADAFAALCQEASSTTRPVAP